MAMKNDVFKNWKDDQDVYRSVSVSSMKKDLENKTVNKLRRLFDKHVSDLQTLSAFFDPDDMGSFLSNYKILPVKKLFQKFVEMYDLLDGDVEAFILHFEKIGFLSKRLSSTEKRQGINTVVKKYNDIFDILFDHDDEDKKDEFLFTVANKFFEFCFYPKTFKKFKQMLKKTEYYPILRLIYSIMWSNLAEIGWQHWHADAIKNLRKDFDAGKQIVYIAGGTDIYQLIKHGIYNIKVIDPMLPTQPKYYSQGWDWFITGTGKNHGVGESVEVKFGKKRIKMVRAKYQPTGEHFDITLSNNKKEVIEQSVTTWHLYDVSSKKMLGKILFDRRLTNQDDFVVSSKKTILISFNELYFVAAPKNNDGWGINPHKFSDNIKLVIKQLQEPVGKKVACNIRHEVIQSDFAFISLGSCVD